MSEARAAAFQRNILLEKLLMELNADLKPSEERILLQGCRSLQHPVVLVVGPLRSGTTLFMQWLANTGLVAYPTNLLSRFYQAPIIGAKIQLLLTDPRFNFRDELGEFIQQAEYKSDNGKTKGVMAPNEFWYFWRRFLKDPDRDVWSNEELLQTMDFRTMIAEIAGVTAVLEKPFAAKGMLFNYNIPFLDSIFDKILFIQIKRNPVNNAASVLEARRRQYGADSTWYSFKIPEYDQLKDLDPIAQAAGQVYYINKAVEKGLEGVADNRKLVVDYEEFCQNPVAVYEELKRKIGLHSEHPYRSERYFLPSKDLQEELKVKIVEALHFFDELNSASSPSSTNR